MTRRALLVVAGIAAVVCAIPLALLGRAVLATPGDVARATAGWPARVQVVPPHRSIADRAASSLLADGGNEAFAEIVAVYRNAVAFRPGAGDPRGPVQISRLIERLQSPAERAQALTMAGTLLAYSAGAGFGVALPASDQAPTATVLAQAIEDFRMAVRSDPGNEAAKYDLELLLRQRRQQTPQRQHPHRRRKSPAEQDTRRKKTATSGQEHHAGIYATGSGY